MRKHNIGFISLGCAKNLVDSEIEMDCLIRNGFIIRFEGTPVCCIRHWHMMQNLKTTVSKSDFQEAKLVKLDGGVYVMREDNEKNWSLYDDEDDY